MFQAADDSISTIKNIISTCIATIPSELHPSYVYRYTCSFPDLSWF